MPTRTKLLARRTLRVQVIQLQSGPEQSICPLGRCGVRSSHLRRPSCLRMHGLPVGGSATRLEVPKRHSNPIGRRVRRKHQRLPSSLLIENAPARASRLYSRFGPPRHFRSMLATTRPTEADPKGTGLTQYRRKTALYCVYSELSLSRKLTAFMMSPLSMSCTRSFS
jgi:hypothetical protein